MKLFRHNRRAARRLAESCVFEILEIRAMMSVVNVADYGAKPGDGQNDLPAIQAALNASQPGDTILFSGGVFDLSGFGNSGGDGLIVPSNRTYLGQNGATLRGHDTQGPQMHVTGDNVTISGLTFQDGGLKVDKGSNLNNNVVIDNNVFNLNTGGVNNNGITATSGLSNSRITNNYFTSTQGGFGILAFNWNGLTIANNEFVNISAGVHMQGFGGSTNLLFEQNYFSGMRGGMGAEIVSNSSITNCIFQDNYYENPNQGTMTHDQLLNFMAFSFPTPTCTNTIIRRNTVIAPQRPDGIGVRIGLETAGINCQVTDNYVVGCEWGITDADGTSPSSVTITGNRMSGAVNGGIRQDHAAAGRTLTQNNNGANTTLTWDINRPKPGIDSRLPGTGPGTGAISTPASPPPASPPPASPPVVTPPVVTLPTVPAEPDVTYLSDLDWTSMVNYWGPAERDMSNGQQPAGDGKMLTINGVTYAKGLGVHGGSDLQYQLDGQYSRFQADIGVDDEVGSKGSVDFQVYLDGVLAYDSSKMTGNDAAKSIDLDVSGKQDIELVVTNAGDNYDYDHADWANARLVPAGASTAEVALSSLTPDSQSSGWGPVELNRSNGQNNAGDGNVITLNGQTYDSGLGVHANSALVYNLDGNYTSFKADVGVDDEVGSRGSVEFVVLVDGVKVFDSGVMTGASATQSVDLDLTGKQQLQLVVVSPTVNIDYDHADWANARLVPVAASTVDVALSSLTPQSQSSGWGPVEINQSNGERGSGDGEAITLNGQTYDSGLGVHANSTMVYDLNGNYTSFQSDVGVDDEVGSNGSVEFTVIVDGVTVFDSGIMTGASPTQTVNVDLTGKQQLTLKVTSPTTNIDFDHADWAGAKLSANT